MILLRSSINYIKKHYLQSLLAIIGIALGISITVAIDIAIVSSKKSFELSNSRVTGIASHQIKSKNNQAIDEEIYKQLKLEHGLDFAAPVIESFVELVKNLNNDELSVSLSKKQNEKEIIKILGVDPIAEQKFRKINITSDTKDYIFFSPHEDLRGLISKKTLDKLGLKLGQSIKLRVGTLIKTVIITGLIEDESVNYENLILMDISDAQELLGLEGKLSYINLKIEKDKGFQAANGYISKKKLSGTLPDALQVQESSLKSKSLQEMTDSFNLNLTALSFLALIVAIFLIYNSLSFSVVQRRKLIAILRAIGLSEKQVIKMIFIEALIFTVIGTLLGLVLGIFLSEILMNLVTQTINDIYFTLEIKKRSISSISLIKASCLGLISGLVAAIIPALDASRSSPLIAMSRSSFETKSNIDFKKLFYIGLILIIIASLLLFFYTGLILSFAALFFILLGFAFMCPKIISFASTALEPLYKKLFGFIGTLSLKSISSQLSRTSIAIATLMIAISISIGLNITIKSFRDTVENWLNSSLKADIYISSPRLVSNKPDKALKQEFIEDLKSNFSHEIEEILNYRNIELMTNIGKINLASIDTSPKVKSLMNFKEKTKNTWLKFQNQENIVLISEAFAYKKKLKINDHIIFLTPYGDREFKVAAIFTDFGSDSGIVMMAKPLYQKLYNDPDVSSIGVIVKSVKGISKEQHSEQVKSLIDRIKSKYNKDYSLFIRSNTDLKKESLAVFDRTFKVTSVLKWISIIVAFIAVLSAFTSLQLEKIREFAVLKANGLSPYQIAQLLSLQTLTMGIFAALLAIPTGIVQAIVMVYIINQRSFGWSLNFSLYNSAYIEAFIFSLLASILAVIYPIYLSNKIKISEALRYE